MSDRPRAFVITLVALACAAGGCAFFIVLASLPGWWGIGIIVIGGGCLIYHCALDGIRSARCGCPRCGYRSGGDQL
jgi:hypothetical protein